MMRLRNPIIHTLLLTLSSAPLLASSAYAQSFPSGSTTYEYDAAGNVKVVKAPLDRVTNLTYDALGRVLSETQPMPAIGVARPVIGTTFDGLDQLQTVTDPRHLKTTYTTDGLGRQNTLASPDTASTTKTYTNAGMLYTSVDARQKKTTYGYDKLNRVTSISYTSGTASWFAYDGGTTPIPNAIGKLHHMTDESGQTLYAYGPFGRLLTKTCVIGSGTAARTHVVRYAYGDSGGAAGKLVGLTYPSGNRINYRYSADGELIALTLNPGRVDRTTDTAVEITVLSGITYHPMARGSLGSCMIESRDYTTTTIGIMIRRLDDMCRVIRSGSKAASTPTVM